MTLDALLSVDGPLLRLLIPIVVCGVLAVLIAALLRVLGGRLLGDPTKAASLARAALVGVSSVGVLLGLGRLVDPTATDGGLRAALAGIIGALPRLTISFVLVIIALLIAAVVRATIERVVGAIRPALGGAVGAIAYWTIVILVVLIAVEQAGMDVGLLRQLLLVVVSGVVLAAALGTGLALKPLLSSVVAGRHVESVLEPGAQVRIVDGVGATVAGEVVSIGHVSVVIRDGDGRMVDVPHTAFLEASTVRS